MTRRPKIGTVSHPAQEWDRKLPALEDSCSLFHAARRRLVFAFPVSGRQPGEISFTASRQHQDPTWWANKNDINASLRFLKPTSTLCFSPILPHAFEHRIWAQMTCEGFFFPFPFFFPLAFVASHSEVCYETGYWWFPRATAFKCAVFPRLSASRPCKFFRAAAITLIEAGGSFKVQLGKWHGCINSFSPSDFPITFLLDLYACLCPPVTPCLTRKRCVFYHAHADVVHVICIARRSVYTPLVHTAALSADWYFFYEYVALGRACLRTSVQPWTSRWSCSCCKTNYPVHVVQ